MALCAAAVALLSLLSSLSPCSAQATPGAVAWPIGTVEELFGVARSPSGRVYLSSGRSSPNILLASPTSAPVPHVKTNYYSECLVVHDATGDLYYGTSAGVSVSRASGGNVPADLSGANVKTVAVGEEATTVFFDPTNPNDLYFATSSKSVFRIKNVNTATLPATPEKLGTIPQNEGEAFGAIDQAGTLYVAGYYSLFKYPSARSLTAGAILATGNVNKACSISDITQHFSRGHRAGVVLHSARGSAVRELSVGSLTPSAAGNGACPSKVVFRPAQGRYATQVAPMAGGAFLAAILRDPTGLYFVPGAPAADLAPMLTASDFSMRVGSRLNAEGKEQLWCNLRDGGMHLFAAPLLAPASGSKVTLRAFAVSTPTLTVAPTTGFISTPYDISLATPKQLANYRMPIPTKPADGQYIGVYAGLYEGAATEASAENFLILCRVDSTPVGRPSTGPISLEVTTAPTCPATANPQRRARFTPASPISLCVYQPDTQSVSTSLLALDQSIGALQRRPIGSTPATAWGALMHLQHVDQTLSPKLLKVDASTLDPAYEYRMGFTRISDAGLPALIDIVEASLRWTTTFHYLAPDLRTALDVSDDSAVYDGCRNDWTCRQPTCARVDTRAAPVKLGGSEAWTNFALDWILPGDGTQTSDYAPHRGRNDNDAQKWNLGGTQNNGGIAPANQVAERWVTGTSESAFVNSDSSLLTHLNITLRYSLPVSCNPYYVQVWLSKIAPGKSGRTSATNPTQACYSPPVDGQPWDPHVIWHSEWLPVENWRGTTLQHSLLPSSVFQAFWHVNVSLPSRHSLLQVNEVVDVDYEGLKSGAALYVGAQFRNWDQQMLQTNPAQYDAIYGLKYASGVQSLGCSSRLAFHWMSDAQAGNVSFPLSASDLTEVGSETFSRSATSLSVQIGTTSDLTVGVYSYTLQAAYISPNNVVTQLGSPVTVLMQAAGFTPMQTLSLSGPPTNLAPRDGGHQLEVRMSTEFASGLRMESQQRLKWDFTPPTSDTVRAWLWSEGEGAACASQPNGPAVGSKVFQSDLTAGVRVCMSGAFADPETGIASVRYALQFRAAGATTWPSSFTSEYTGDWLALTADSVVSALRTVAARLEDGYEYRLGLFAQNTVGLPIAHTDAEAFPFYVWTSNSMSIDLTPPTIASGQQPFMFLGDTTQEQLNELQTTADIPAALTTSTRGPSTSEQWFVASVAQLRLRTAPSYQIGTNPVIQWSDPESGMSSLVQMALTDTSVPPSSESGWATTGANPPSELALASLLTPTSGSALQPEQGVPMYVHLRYLNRAMLPSAVATRSVGVDLTPPDVSLVNLHAVNPDWTSNPTRPIIFVEYPQAINLRWNAPVDPDSNVRLLSLVVRNADGSVKSQARYVAAAATSLTVTHASLPVGLQQAGTQLVLELTAWNGAHLQSTTSLSLLWDVPRPGTAQAVYDGPRAMERHQTSFYTTGQAFLAAWFDFAFLNAPVDSYTVTIGTDANPAALMGATVFAADVMNVTIDDVASVPSVECSRVFTRVVARVQNSDVTIQAESTGQLIASQPPAGGRVFDLTTLPQDDQEGDFASSMTGLSVAWSGFTHGCLPLRYVVRLLNGSAAAGEEGVLVVDQEYGAPGTSATHDASDLPAGEYLYEVCAWGNPWLSRCVRSDGFLFDPTAPSAASVVVRNGPTGAAHEAFNPSLSVVRANWQGWSETPAGIRYFVYRVDEQATATYAPNSGWINAGTASQVVLRNADLVAGSTYYIHVAAVTHAGAVSDVASSQAFVALAVPPVPLPLLETITAVDVDGRPLTLHYATSWQSLLFNDSSLAVSTGALTYRFAIGSSPSAPTLHTKSYVRVPVDSTVRGALSDYFAGVERDHTRSFLTDGHVWYLSVTAINAVDLSSNRLSEGVQLDQSAPHCAAPFGVTTDGVASSALPTLTSLRIGWDACTDDESPLMVEEAALSLGADDYSDQPLADFQRYRYQQGAKRELVFSDLPADKVIHGARVHIWLRATNAAGLQTLRHSSLLIDTLPPAAPLLEPVSFGAHALASASSSVVALPQRVVACQRDSGHLSASWHAFNSLSGVQEYRVRLLDGAGETLLEEQRMSGDRTYAEFDEATPGQFTAAAYVYAVISATSRAGVSTDPAGALVGGVYVAREGDAPLSTRGVLDASVRLSEARGDDTSPNVVHGVFVNVTLDGVFSGMVHQLVYSVGSSEGGAQLHDWTPVPVATQVHDFVSRNNGSGGVREYGTWLRLGPLTVRNNEAIILTLKASTCAGAAVLVSSEPMPVRFALPNTAAPAPSVLGVSVSSPLSALQLEYPEVADLQSASPRPGVAFVTRPAGATPSQPLELSLELSGLFYDPAGLVDITATLLHPDGTALQQSSEVEAECPSVRIVTFAEGASSDDLIAPLLFQLHQSLVTQGACYRIDLLARNVYGLTASVSSNVCIDLGAPQVQLQAGEPESSAIIALEPLPSSGSSPSSSSVLLCPSSATSLHVHWRPLLAADSYVAIMSLCVSSQLGVTSLDASVPLSASGVCDVSAATSILPEGQPTSLHFSSLNMQVASEYVVWLEAVSAVGLRTYVRSLPIRPVLQAPLAASDLSSNQSDASVASSASSPVSVQVESSLMGAQADGSWFFGSDSTFNLSWASIVSPDGGPLAASWTLLRDGDVRGDSAVLPWQSLSGEAVAARSVLLHAESAAAASSGAWAVRSGASYRVALRVETCSGLASLFLSNRLVASVHAPVYGVANLTNLLADPEGEAIFYATSDHIELDGLTLRFGSFVDAVAAISHYNVVLLSEDGSEVLRLLDAFKLSGNETQQVVEVPLHDDYGQPLLASVTLVPQATSALSDLFELRINGSASLAAHLRAAVSASSGAALRLRVEGANVLELVRGVEVKLVLDDAEPDWFTHVRLLRNDDDVPAGPGASDSSQAETDREQDSDASAARCVRAEQLDARRLLVQWASNMSSEGSTRARAPVQRLELALESSDARLASNGTELVTNVTIAGEQVSFVRACVLRTVAEWPLDAPMLEASEKGHVLSFARLLEGGSACMPQDGALHRLVLHTVNVLGRHSEISGEPFFFVRNPMTLQQQLVERSSLLIPAAVSGSWASDAAVGDEAAPRVVDLPLAVRPWPLLAAVLGQLRFAVGVGSTPTNDAYLELTEATATTSDAPSAVRLLSGSQLEEEPDAWRQLRVSSLPSGSDVLVVRASGVPASVADSPLYVQVHADLLSCGGMRVLVGSGSSALDLTPPELDDSQTVPALKPTPILLLTNLSSDAARLDIWPTFHSEPHLYVPHTQPTLSIAFQPWRDIQHGVQRYEWALVDGQQTRLSPAQLAQEARNAAWKRLRIPAQIDLASGGAPVAADADGSGASSTTSGSDSGSAQALQWVYLSASTNQPVGESEYLRWVNSTSADAADNLPVQWLAFEWPATGGQQLPLGLFTLLVRGVDGAGGVGDAVRAFLTIDDTPAHLPVGERITHGTWPLPTPPTPNGQAAASLAHELLGAGPGSSSVSGVSLSSLLSSRVVSVRCQRNATTHISWPRWVDEQSGGVRSERVTYRTAVVEADSHSLTPQVQQRILDQLDACDDGSVATSPTWLVDESSGARVARVLQCWTAYEDGVLSRGLVSAATSLTSSSSTGAVATAASAPSSGGIGSDAAGAQAARLPGARLTASFTPSARLAEPVAAGAVLHWLVESRNGAGLRERAWSGGVTLLCGQSFYAGGSGGDVSAGGSSADPLEYETLQAGACLPPAQLVHSRLHCID